MKFVPQAARLAICAIVAAAAVVAGAGATHVSSDGSNASAIGSIKKDTGW